MVCLLQVHNLEKGFLVNSAVRILYFMSSYNPKDFKRCKNLSSVVILESQISKRQVGKKISYTHIKFNYVQ